MTTPPTLQLRTSSSTALAQPGGKRLSKPRALNRARGRTRASAVRCGETSSADRESLKANILQVAALTDRGQRHNKLVSNAYTSEEKRMKSLVEELAAAPSLIEESTLRGEWELVYASCELFRSSPFFLAIENAFKNEDKSSLFFKLHLLQVGSWGASTVGRVAQRLDFEESILESEFDTILFGLTVIPVVGWFKLLPTFGGTVVTLAKDLKLEGTNIRMELDKTRVVETEGVEPGLLGRLLMNRWAPVNAVWQLLPWNWGSKPTCSMSVKYVDESMRVMEDMYGEIFVYTRPFSA